MFSINLLNNFIKFNHYSYRNIYTIIESQNLFDDLVSLTEEKNKVLQKWENNSSDISHFEGQKNRVFQYGNAENSIGGLFTPPYNQGRFGDGQFYGVWYGALEQETSLWESLYHQCKRVRNAFKQKGAKEIIITERKMFKAKLQTEFCVDLNSEAKRDKNLFSELTQQQTDNIFCRELGNRAFKNNIAMLLVPSVRRLGGICSPVFKESAIKKELPLYYLRWIFHKNGHVEQEKISHQKTELTLPKEFYY